MTIKVTYNVTDVYMSQSVSPVYINISYSDGGQGIAVWGSITGTLSNQTDLQNALNAKFDDPTGTTSQYIRGDGSLATFPAIPSGTVTSVGLTMPSAFAVANSPITSSGTLAVTATGDTTQYIAGDGSLVAFPITGQAGTLVREVRNNSGATITKGTVVYINGASGNRPTIAKAIATGDATSAQTFGLVQADILNNANGYIVAFGDLDGLDTSAITEGSQLYLSATVLGGYTTVKQYAPNHLVYIGVVTRSHPNQGRIEVRIANGFEIDEIHNVSAQTPSNNDGLFYNSTTSLWENKSIATALGFTPANAATTLTINGVTYDLSANRSWTIAAGISGSGTAGQVTYWTGASAVSGSNNLFWDNTNGRLGIGTNAPALRLSVIDNTGTNVASFRGSASSYILVGDASLAGESGVNCINSQAQGFFAVSGSQVVIAGASGANVIRFNLGGSERMRISPTFGLMIGTPSDLGVRLGVVGDTLLRGSGNTSATTALTVQNSSSTNLLRVLNNGDVSFGADAFYWDAVTSRLGIGTNAPTNALHIVGTNNVISRIRSTTNTGASAYLVENDVNSTYEMGMWGSTRAGYGAILSGNAYLYGSVDLAITSLGAIKFGNGAGTPFEKMRLFATGNLVIQNSGTFLDGGQRLQVYGDTLLRGSGATSATTALTVQNSSSTNLLTIDNGGYIEANTSTSSIFVRNGFIFGATSAAAKIGPSASNAINVRFTQGSTNLLGAYGAGINNSAYLFSYPNSNNTDAGTNCLWGIIHTFNPTSASSGYIMAGLQPTINQTGGANGITRGLYVNPTLTAAADWRSVEWSNNSGWGLRGEGTANNYLGGNVAIGSTSNTTDWLNIAASTTAKAHIFLAAGVAPTSPANGDIWFDGTDIKMRIGGVTKTFTLI